jgi:hypothetical protein
MYGVCMSDEVRPGPRKAVEEFRRQQVSLEPIAAATGKHEVAGVVGAAVRQRMNVVERGEIELQFGGAIYTASAAVSHCGVFYGPLV